MKKQNLTKHHVEIDVAKGETQWKPTPRITSHHNNTRIKKQNLTKHHVEIDEDEDHVQS